MNDAAFLALVRQNAVSPSTLTSYLCTLYKFLLWLQLNHVALLTVHFYEDAIVDNAYPSKSAFKTYMLTAIDQQRCPVNLGTLTPDIIMEFVVSLRGRDGQRLSSSSQNCNRSAITFLYRAFRQLVPADVTQRLSQDFRGLKRTNALMAADGEATLRQGMDPLPFSVYRVLCREIMKQPTAEFTFAHCFMVICWNLICRSSNALHIRFVHMGWREDALQIKFAQQKNDQLGEKPKDPRSVYANPIMPEVCPILALALFLLNQRCPRGENCLFPGSAPYDRFRKVLARIRLLPDVVTIFESYGVDPDNVGTHSLRKGAATYVSSGSTAAPSVQAINLRAGWAMGGVQDRYYRFEGAGDQYVGRTVCGLPIHSDEFATLCPSFKTLNIAKEAGQLFFPSLPESMGAIKQYMAASFCYHAEYLDRLLPEDHHIRHYLRGQYAEQIVRWKEDIFCGYSHPDVGMVATGVPPHVKILAASRECIGEVRQVPDRMTGQLEEFMERRALDHGSITRQGLEAAMVQLEGRLETILERHSLARREVANGIEDQNLVPRQLLPQAQAGRQVYVWDGRMNLLPENHALPKGTISVAWHEWVCGTQSIPPLRRCTGKDFSNRKARKRFSNLKFLMTKIEDRARESGIWQNTLSIQEANNILEMCQDAIELPGRTEADRERRIGQLNWATCVNILRRG